MQTLEQFCCGDFSFRVTALLGSRYIDPAIRVFCFLEMPELLLMMYGVALASLISSALYMHPKDPMLAF